MDYAGVMQLIRNNQQSANWKQIDNATGDGGWVAFCTGDVALTLQASIAWHGAKPSTRFVFCYGGTVIGWFEIPILSRSDGPAILIEALSLAAKQFTAGS